MKFHLDIVVALLLVGAAQAVPQNESVQGPRTAAQRAAAENITFEPLLAGNGKNPDGSRFSFQHYRASDGIAVLVRSERFASAGRASAAFRKRLRSASRIVERGDAPGDEGGERAVLLFKPRKSAGGYAAIVRLEGPVIHIIESPSLKHALTFERGG